MGRWSRLLARKFLQWLAVAPGARWLDVGCGGGALTRTVLELASPVAVVGVDPSAAFLAASRDQTADHRALFLRGDASALPCADAVFDVAIAGLALNFFPDPLRGVAEMRRTARPGGVVAAYVWDYAGGMQMLRAFWDAATSLNPSAVALDEGRRFPLCQPEPLAELFRSAGLGAVAVHPLDIQTTFRNFDDYWDPFLSGQGPAPGYVAALTEAQRSALKDRLSAELLKSPDGAIHLTARAWAARGLAAKT